MIGRVGDGAPDGPEADRDPRLAELAEEITRRLQAGEAFDAEAYAALLPPDCAGTIRDLLPTMNDLVDLGRTAARDRRDGPRPGPSHSTTRKDPLP